MRGGTEDAYRRFRTKVHVDLQEGYIIRDSMTLQKGITIRHIPSRTMNYDSFPAQYKLYVLIPFNRFDKTVIDIREKKAVQNVRYQSNLMPTR